MTAVPKPAPRLPKKERPYVEPITDVPFAKARAYNKTEDALNRLKVIERDEGVCQWHRLVWGKRVRGSTPHHIHGRRRAWSVRDQITLCYDCHHAYHTAAMDDNGKIIIQTEDLEDLMLVLYGRLSIGEWRTRYQGRT